MSWSVSHLLSIVAGSAVAQKVLEAIASKGAEVGAEAVKNRLKDTKEYRGEMITKWQDTAENHPKENWRKGAEGLLAHSARHQAERGSDDFMIRILGEVWQHVSHSSYEKAIRHRVFYGVLGHLSAEEFDQALEMYRDDKIRYIAKQVKDGAIEAYAVVEAWIGSLIDRGFNILIGGSHLESKQEKLAVLFAETVETADAVGAVALKGVNKLLLGLESLIDKSPPHKKGRHRDWRNK